MGREPGFRELEQAVALLEKRAEQQRRSETLTKILFRISNAVNTTRNLNELYASIHKALEGYLHLPNFYIALYDSVTRSISFPYFRDQFDHDYDYVASFSEDKSLTGDVIKAGIPLYLTQDVLEAKARADGIIGTVPKLWIGIPLRIGGVIIGVMAVQSYDDPNAFTVQDMELFSSVSDQIAVAIDRKQTQERLKKSKERYRKLTENINDVIWSMDMDLNYTFISPSFKRVHQWSNDDLSSITVDQVLTPNSLGLAFETLTAGLEEGERTGDFSRAYTLHIEMYKGDGSTFWGEILALPELDENGLPIGIFGVTRDISQRLAAEQAMKESEEKYRTLIETTDTGFVILDNMFRVRDANQSYIRLSGNSCLDDIMGRCVLDWTAKEKQQALGDSLSICLEKGRVTNVETVFCDDRGNCVQADINAATVMTSSGPQIMALCRDISRSKRVQEMMIQSEKLFSLGGLSAGMAHEINTPLAAIIQNIQVVLNRLTRTMPANTAVADSLGLSMQSIRAYIEQRGISGQLEAVHDAGRRAADIVANMLSFSRRESNHFEHYRLSHLLDRTIELLQNDYNVNRNYDFRFITIHRFYDDSVPPVLCEGSTIQQVFLNILKNGAEAMADYRRAAKNGVDTEKALFNLHIRREEGMAVVEIEDNGPGMDETQRMRVFDPFFTTKDTGSGTGLGLSLCYFIITEHHGGLIEVVSEPGKGSRFIIHLPFEQV